MSFWTDICKPEYMIINDEGKCGCIDQNATCDWSSYNTDGWHILEWYPNLNLL